MKILAFAATNHKDSINKKLVSHALDLLKDGIVPEVDIDFIDLNDFELPLYRQDREADGGVPQLAHGFYKKIGNADAIIVSFAEHNGSYTAAYKNLFDWTSRIDQKLYQNKPMVVMSASPGGRGGAGVLGTVEQVAPYFGMDIKATVSVPLFGDNFDIEAGKLTNVDIQNDLIKALKSLA